MKRKIYRIELLYFDMSTFKVILVGDGGVGKSSLVGRHHNGDFDKRYIKTLGVDVTPLRFHTNYGEMIINIWDCAGDPQFQGLGDGYYIQAEGAIFAFSLDSRSSMNNVNHWISKVDKVIKGLPSTIVGLKFDAPREVSSAEFAAKFSKTAMALYEISSKTSYNFEKPFLSLLRKMSHHEDLVFVSTPISPSYMQSNL